MDNIKCPKCGSTQLTTDKKGFSGKKAVAGAVLTGGIGLLAGTIGSNKIIITCLSCGKQFKPGEDFEANLKKKAQQEQAMKSPGFWIYFIIIMVLFIILFRSCFSSTTEENKNAIAIPTQSVESLSTSLDKYYIIDKEDNDQTNIRLYLYVSDVTKIKDINQLLIGKYNKDKSKYMGIYFFDKKGVGKTYMDKQFNEKVSEREKDNLYKHLIAVYNFNPSNSFEKLEYSKH